MPIYLLSLFRMLKSVKSRLEKIQRDFLWGGGSTVRKIHLVNWNFVSQGKDKGGLGLRRLDLLNRALLGKWAWRFAVEDDSMWRSCIKTQYGSQNGGWFTPYPRGSYGVGLWKSIAKEIEQLKKDNVFKLGDGRKIRFWEDTWCGRQPLCDAFPDLYSIAVSIGAKATEIWVREDGGGA